MSALFALNANEEKISGVSLHIINSHFMSPQVPGSLYKLNLSCVQTKKTQKRQSQFSCIFTLRVVQIPSETLKDIYTKHLQYRKFMADVMAEGFWPEIHRQVRSFRPS